MRVVFQFEKKIFLVSVCLASQGLAGVDFSFHETYFVETDETPEAEDIALKFLCQSYNIPFEGVREIYLVDVVTKLIAEGNGRFHEVLTERNIDAEVETGRHHPPTTTRLDTVRQGQDFDESDFGVRSEEGEHDLPE